MTRINVLFRDERGILQRLHRSEFHENRDPKKMVPTPVILRTFANCAGENVRCLNLIVDAGSSVISVSHVLNILWLF